MAKAPDAFRTISEVSELLDTPPHVLRFWESRFTQVRPVKRAGGRRYYRPADLLLLGGIKRLLHDDGMTIRGVQKMLSDQGVTHVAGLADPALLAANDGSAPARNAERADDATRESALFDADPDYGAADAEDDPRPEEDMVAPPQPETAQRAQATDTGAQDEPTEDAAAIAQDPVAEDTAASAPVTPALAPPVDEAGEAEADLLARIRATMPGPVAASVNASADTGSPEGPVAPADPSSEAEDRAMPEAQPPAPEAAAPTLAQIAARLRRLGPDDIATNRAEIEALRARLLALHKARSERLVAARF